MMQRALSSLCIAFATFALLACGGSSGSTPTEPLALDQGTDSALASDRLARGNDRYDGIVAFANPGDLSFQLEDGTLVRTSPATRWKSGGDRILSIAGMIDAMNAGMTVRARGKGTAEGPSVLVADDVDARADRTDAGQEQRFDEIVTDSDGTTIELANGTFLDFNAATRWKSGPDRLTSVSAIAAAVGAGLSVRARGRALDQGGPPLLTIEIDARVREAATTNFRGPLTDLDSIAGTLQLGGDTTIIVLESTSWKRGPRRIGSFAEIEVAFAAGAQISVRGKGAPQAEGIAAAELDVQFAARALARFKGFVDSVDLGLGQILLENGQVITVFDGTDWRRGGRWLGSLEAIEAALAAGDRVRVAGKGTESAPGEVLAALVKARVKPGDDDDPDPDDEDPEDSD